MKEIFKYILNDIGQISQFELVNSLLKYREFMFFLIEKLAFEEENMLDLTYRYNSSVRHIKKRIVRSNKIILKFLNNEASNICFSLDYFKNYSLNDQRAIAFALHQILLATYASFLMIKSYESLPVEILENKIYLQTLVMLAKHELVVPLNLDL